MKRLKINKYQMVTRVDDFLSRFVNLFPNHTAAGEVLDLLRSARVNLTQFLSARVTSNLTIRTTSAARKAARQRLMTLLDAIHRTALAVGVDMFRVPVKSRDQALIDSGRGFAIKAEPLKEQLVFHGLPPEFLQDLNVAVQAFEKAILEHGNAKTSRSATIQEFEKTLDYALSQVHRLEALVSNLVAKDTTAMAAWNAARRIEPSGGTKSPGVSPPVPDAAVSTA